jgi:hypothetical protein
LLLTASWSIVEVSWLGAPPSTDRLRPPAPLASAVVDSADVGTVIPSGSLAGTKVNAPGLPLKLFICCSGLIASGPIRPVEASEVGWARVWLALAPVTNPPPDRSEPVIGRAPPSFLRSVAPSSDMRSTIAASPVVVPSSPVEPLGSNAVPLRSPPIPPGLEHDEETGVSLHPSSPKRSSS